jgi:hypothetical protein
MLKFLLKLLLFFGEFFLKFNNFNKMKNNLIYSEVTQCMYLRLPT